MIMLYGLGLDPIAVKTTTSTTSTTSSIPKSDYIKQLQCLLNIAVNMPEAINGFRSTKELWSRALAWTNLTVDGVIKQRDADTINMLNAAGIRQFWSEYAATTAGIAANLSSYINGALSFIRGSAAANDWVANVTACDFPARTAAAQAAAAAAAKAAADAAAAKAAADAAAAKAAADAAAKAAADAAAKAAADAAADAAARAKAVVVPQVTADPRFVVPAAKSPPGNQVTTVSPGVEPVELAPAKKSKKLLMLGILGIGAGFAALAISRRRK